MIAPRVLPVRSGMSLGVVEFPVPTVAVKLEDRGPVFFRDRRVGRGGREFGVLKFRTMVPDADRLFGPRQAEKNDPRVTKLITSLRRELGPINSGCSS